MAYLYLEDGTLLEGRAVGATGKACGEVVFDTCMEGYQERLTDPAYAGQIVLFTYPVIGNYGVNAADFESPKVHAAGVILHDLCDEPSNFMSEKTLGEFLKQQNVCGIAGLDTRYLTRKIRAHGGLRAAILPKKPGKNFVFPSLAGEFQSAASQGVARYPGSGANIAVLDFGVKSSQIESLKKLGANVSVYPAQTSAEDILKSGAAGVLLSGGPWDPAAYAAKVAEIRRLADKLPVFGVGLGCQLLAMAYGSRTKKLPHGHRGANQPVKNLKTGKMLVTSQNHGYTIDEKQLPGEITVTFRNWNDASCEGIEIAGRPAFGVLFEPQEAAGPHDSSYLYESFLALLEKGE